jgi:hypothetical protein
LGGSVLRDVWHRDARHPEEKIGGRWEWHTRQHLAAGRILHVERLPG